MNRGKFHSELHQFEHPYQVHGQYNEDDSDDAPPQKAPYFGMTGNQLNVWVTVACTTAMTLFGMCVMLIQVRVI